MSHSLLYRPIQHIISAYTTTWRPVMHRCNPIILCLFSFYPQETREPPVGLFATANTLSVEVGKVHRRFSGTLLLPPLSWRQAEMERDRGRPLTPEEDPVTRTRPTSLPISTLPRIDITEADPDRWGDEKSKEDHPSCFCRHVCLMSRDIFTSIEKVILSLLFWDVIVRSVNMYLVS